VADEANRTGTAASLASMSRWATLLWLPMFMLGLAGFLGWSGVALLSRPDPRPSELLAWLFLVAATVVAAGGINAGRQRVWFSSGGFRKRHFGSFVESRDGFAVQVLGDGFPAVKIRYKEGPRTMDVFAEAMAKTTHLVLDRSTMAYWNPPYTREGMDDATRQTVFDRIISALSYGGYVIETNGGFPKSGDQVLRRIRLAELMQRWRDGKMNPPVPWQGSDTPK
jgi:hypothetical protein